MQHLRSAAYPTADDGYDSKAAMHCLRLYFECIELMQLGKITLPRPERDLLIQVRQGLYTLEQFGDMANDLRSQAEHATLSSSLPSTIDQGAISALIASVHRRYWNEHSAKAGA